MGHFIAFEFLRIDFPDDWSQRERRLVGGIVASLRVGYVAGFHVANAESVARVAYARTRTKETEPPQHPLPAFDIVAELPELEAQLAVHVRQLFPELRVRTRADAGQQWGDDERTHSDDENSNEEEN